MVCCFFFCLRHEQSAQCKIVIEKCSHLLILGSFGIAYARPVATAGGGGREFWWRGVLAKMNYENRRFSKKVKAAKEGSGSFAHLFYFNVHWHRRVHRRLAFRLHRNATAAAEIEAATFGTAAEHRNHRTTEADNYNWIKWKQKLALMHTWRSDNHGLSLVYIFWKHAAAFTLYSKQRNYIA